MAKLDSKKITDTLKGIDALLGKAVKTLNDMSDGEFVGSTIESDPLGSAGIIVRILQSAQAKAADQLQYGDKTPDEVAELQQAARQAELEAVREQFNQKLAKRYEQPAPEVESTGDETPQA